jgi:DNA polymerase I-like protein with 3'-5' exonuclease and polymerase domains
VITPRKALELLAPLKKVGLDTETMGFDPYTKQLMLLQLGCYDFQVVIDCSTVDVHIFKEFLESDRLFIGWNIKFDMKFLFHQKIVLKEVYDGFIAEKLMWLGYPSGTHAMSLKAAGENYLGVELDKTIRGRIMWAGLSDEVIEYAANDVKYLEKIMDAQAVELHKKELTTANIYEQKSVPWLAYTEYCGVLLDIPRWQSKMALDSFTEFIFEKALNDWVVASATGETTAYWYIQTEGLSDKDLIKARKKMKGKRCPEKDIKGEIRGYAEAYEVPIDHKVDKQFIKKNLQGDLFLGFLPPTCVVNWKSPKQVIPLFKSLGLNLITKDKETGEIKESIEEKVIAPQAHLSTLIYLYLEYQGAKKLTSTYGQNVLDQINKVSHRLHTNFNQLGTDTGRLSSGGKDKVNKLEYLNFQNFPHDAETRACFISGPKMKWISCDYSGQESRIIADITNDEAMLDLFNNGSGDVHSLVAKMAYPEVIKDCPVEEVKQKFPEQRQDAKGVEFAINYGGDANTIASNKGIPIKEAQKIYDNYMKGFKGMKAYQDGQRKFVMDNGYILLNPLSLHKAYIYDYPILKGIKKRLTSDFWETYRGYKGQESLLPKAVQHDICRKFAEGTPNEQLIGVYPYKVKKANKEEIQYINVTIADTYIYPVKYYFKRKSSSEKQAINYPCQSTGAVMFKTASIFLWEYLLKNDLIFKVKLCVPAHDEWNIEVPEDIAEEMTKVLQECMSKAGEFFCRKLPMPAEATCSTHWIH